MAMAALLSVSYTLGFAIHGHRLTVVPRAPHPTAKVAVEQFISDLEFLGPVHSTFF
jgi:hypothetical protein